MKNGKKNGHDKNSDKVIRFPSKADQKRKEKTLRAATAEPFFNTGRIPPLTRNIVLLFFAVHLPLYLLLDAGQRLQIFFDFGFVPAYYTGITEWKMSAFLAPFTYSFIHSGIMHLVFNSVMMLAMGVFMERTFGARRMFIFFIISGLAGAALHFAFHPYSTLPVIGASGNISGLFGVTFLLMHQQGMLGNVGQRGPLPLIIFWVIIMTLTGLIGGNIAWLAHLGGFLGGIGLYYVLKKNWVNF